MNNLSHSSVALGSKLERKLLSFLDDYYRGNPIEIEHEKRWSLDRQTKVIDVAIANNDTLLAVFEIKNSKSPDVVERATKQLINMFNGNAIPICYVVIEQNNIKGF